MKKAFRTRVVRDFQKHKFKYLIVIPIIIYLILFCYKPMYGVIIAFKKYRPSLGIAESSWVGFDNFMRFFNDPWIWRLLRNTISISFLMLLFSFPAAIFLALLLNEVKVSWFKRTVQTITYMPHFIALVVVCGLINSFCQSKGLLNDIIVFFGGERSNLLANPKLFYPIYVISGIWQNTGWSSIIYLAALAGIDQEQYEAAVALGKDLETKKVVVKAKCGDGGRMFGTVSTKEIAAAAKSQIGLELDKKKMQLPEPIRSFGMTEVAIKLHPKVTGKFTVHVVEI